MANIYKGKLLFKCYIPDCKFAIQENDNMDELIEIVKMHFRDTHKEDIEDEEVEIRTETE